MLCPLTNLGINNYYVKRYNLEFTLESSNIGTFQSCLPITIDVEEINMILKISLLRDNFTLT